MSFVRAVGSTRGSTLSCLHHLRFLASTARTDQRHRLAVHLDRIQIGLSHRLSLQIVYSGAQMATSATADPYRQKQLVAPRLALDKATARAVDLHSGSTPVTMASFAVAFKLPWRIKRAR